ncbi:MAG: hypothetical protein GY913_24215 [Proteobacteria bacterium]|nr:hypothetical protein [Pseudomonadota bacterium]MCP4920020.1 hypothetical protein [Pseudomonadota bacterium]
MFVLPTWAGRKDKPKKLTPQEMAQQATDDAMVASAEQYRAMTAGDFKGVYGWAGALAAAADVGTVERGRVPDDHLAEFFAALDDLKNPSLGLASGVVLAAGNSFLALDLAQASLDVQPDNAALTTWLSVADDRTQAASNCQKTLKNTQSDIQKFDTLSLCNAAIGTDWASTADQT